MGRWLVVIDAIGSFGRKSGKMDAVVLWDAIEVEESVCEKAAVVVTFSCIFH